MTRQRLSISELARLVDSSISMVYRWRKGVHKVPGGVQAFLEIREGLFHPEDQVKQDAKALLRYCDRKGLSYRKAVRSLAGHQRTLDGARQKRNYITVLERKARKWDS